MNYDAIVVGGGIAGLTAAAFLTKAGYTTLLLRERKPLRRFGKYVRAWRILLRWRNPGY